MAVSGVAARAGGRSLVAVRRVAAATLVVLGTMLLMGWSLKGGGATDPRRDGASVDVDVAVRPPETGANADGRSAASAGTLHLPGAVLDPTIAPAWLGAGPTTAGRDGAASPVELDPAAPHRGPSPVTTTTTESPPASVTDGPALLPTTPPTAMPTRPPVAHSEAAATGAPPGSGAEAATAAADTPTAIVLAATAGTNGTLPTPTHAGSDLNPWLLVNPDQEIAVAKSKLRLYIYNFQGLLPRHPYESLDCEKTLWINYRMESTIPAALAQHMHVVTDPAQADLFLVPHNGTCYGLYHGKVTNTTDIYGSGRNLSSMYLEPLLRTVVEKFPYYNASSGRDHVYVFTFDRALVLFNEYVYNVTLSGIRLQSYGWDEAAMLRAGLVNKTRPRPGAADPPMYSKPDDIVIPQLVPLTLVRPDQVRPVADRGILAAFVGTIMDIPNYSKGARIGLARAYENDTRLGLAPDRILIHRGHLRHQYAAILANSSFALCPGGWAPWSPRLFDAISQATIPVIIADGIVEPFETYLNWRAFSMKATHAHVGTIKDHLLKARGSAATASKLRALQEIAPYLHWTPLNNANLEKRIGLIILALCERVGKCSPKRRYTAPALATDEYY